MTESSGLPSSVYLVIGILSVGNLGVIISLLAFIFRAGMFVARTNAGIADAKGCAVRAHDRIDKMAGSDR